MIRTITAAALALLVSTSANAQTKLFALLSDACTFDSCEPSQVMEVDVDGRRILEQTQVVNARGVDGAALTADGRYLVWAGGENILSPEYLSIFDTATNITIGSVLLGQGPQHQTNVLTHPSKTRVFLLRYQESTHVLALEPDRQQLFPTGCTGFSQRLVGLSADGARLFVFCMTNNILQSGETRVLDSETGALLATVPNTSLRQTPNAAGTELFTAQASSSGPVFRRLDVATGAVLAENASTAFFGFSMTSDPRTGHVYVTAGAGSSGFEGYLAVFDGGDLHLIREFSAPRNSGVPIVFSPDDALAFWTTPVTFVGGRTGTRFTIIDTERVAIAMEAEVPTPGGPRGLVIGRKPAAPLNLSSVVTARQVTLQWTAGVGVAPSNYVIEAGLTSGATALTLTVPAMTTAYVVNDVPPGTYYVRLRAVNAGGALSAVSNEVQIVVP